MACHFLCGKWTTITTRATFLQIAQPAFNRSQPNCYLQEGQHPLTGQRTANFSLLSNQWAERRLVTQWRHGCRAMRRSVCNAGASNGGRSLCVQISRDGATLANILIPLERQLIALQLCRFPLKFWLKVTYPLLKAASFDTFCLVAPQS